MMKGSYSLLESKFILLLAALSAARLAASIKYSPRGKNARQCESGLIPSGAAVELPNGRSVVRTLFQRAYICTYNIRQL